MISSPFNCNLRHLCRRKGIHESSLSETKWMREHRICLFTRHTRRHKRTKKKQKLYHVGVRLTLLENAAVINTRTKSNPPGEVQRNEGMYTGPSVGKNHHSVDVNLPQVLVRYSNSPREQMYWPVKLQEGSILIATKRCTNSQIFRA